jgi:hypothetical protein
MNILIRALPALALSLPLVAQGVSLDKQGGALPGIAAFPIAGTAGDQYFLLMSGIEQTTPVPSLGITLGITTDLIDACANTPTFLGTLDGTGRATAAFQIPNIPALESLPLSFQAITSNGTVADVSNLVRLTAQIPGTFKTSLTQPSLPIAGGGAAVGSDGSVLVVGGTGPVAQLYESRTEEWSLAGASFGVGLLAQTTALADGRILFTGGLGLNGQPTTAAAVYDPVTQQTTTLALGTARAGHGASLLGNGRVLITGGLSSFSLTDPLSLFTSLLNTSEIFDPATNTFSAGSPMLEARAFHTSSSLTNGQVLIAGGLSLLPIVNIPTVSFTAYLYNPNSGGFGLPALMNGPRFLHSAVGLSNGRVLIAGGLTLDLSQFLQTGQIQDIIIGTRDDCQLYQSGLFGFGTFTTVPGMQEGRAGAAIAALPNGEALIAGGFRLTIDIPNASFELTATGSADLFSQGPNRIQATGSMSAARIFPVSVNLPDGTVMIVGGGLTQAEIYQR